MEQYRSTLGATVTEPDDLHEHGVTVAFVELSNTKIELVHPLGEDSPIRSFLEKTPGGGIHHVCYESITSLPHAIDWSRVARGFLATVNRGSAPTESRSCFSTPRNFPEH